MVEIDYDSISDSDTESDASGVSEEHEGCCLSCKHLGQKTDSSLLLLTLSPDIQKDGYNEMSPTKQYNWLQDKIKLGLKRLSNIYYIDFVSIHFEFTKAVNIHAHIIIGMESSLQSYEIHCAHISKIFHKLIGRPSVKSMVAAKAEWVVEPDTLYEYVNKENVFPAIHLHRTTDTPLTLIQWLTTK